MASAWIRKHWAALAVLAITGLAIVVIRLEGRIWFCDCWQLRFVIARAYSSHTSQHLSDPYTLTHLLHGLLFYWALLWLLPRTSWQTRLVLSTAIEALWEIVENSTFVINRYRDATAALGYTGDSVVNAAGDILACVIGYALAGKIGLRWSIVLFIAIEVGLLVTIRDNLLLNVVMLFFPLESLKQWQLNQ
jgi:hypothetical protein